MISVAARRWRNLLLALLAASAAVVMTVVADASLLHVSYLSGWMLLAAVLFLTLFSVRKRLSFLPLWTAASWLQVHVWVGLLTIVLFLLHIQFRIPNGPLEVALAVVFSVIALSGVAGIILSRGIARRLTRRGEEVIYERIPEYRRDLRDEADVLVRRSVDETGSSTIADFYTARLRHLFSGSRDYLQHLFELNLSRYALVTEFMSVGRYLNDREQAILDELRELVIRNDELNYHRALHLTLKAWLFIHVPLTYSMLILIAVHVLLVYVFGDGLS